jgi:hypothetical protein
MRVVFISALYSLASRNILNSGVLEELLAQDAKVILFVLPAKKSFYSKAYPYSNVIVEEFDSEKFNDRKEGLFKSIALLLISTNVMKFRKIKMVENGGSYLKYFYHMLVTAVFGNLKIVKVLFRKLDEACNKKDAFRSYFEKYKPDVVFAPDVFGSGDVLLLKSAQIHKVRTLGMVASWDNNTTKGLMRVVPNRLLVQNKIIEEESINIQNISSEIIKVVGIAHYDYYRNYQPISREEYFNKLGIDKSKRLIMFSPAGDKFITTDWQICEILKEAYTDKKITDDIVTLIRVHPANIVSFGKFTPNEHFVVEVPGVRFEGLSDKRNELDKKSLDHLLDTLAHVDLVINVVSSIVIDAAVLDKPVITIGFEGWEKKVPFGSSVKRYHMDENMDKLLKIGGTPIVRNSEELIKQINIYLKHPEFDRVGRKKIVEKQCWRLDGKAKVRIAESILEGYK